MADINIPGLPPLADIDQQLTDVYEISDAIGANPSKKETRQQQLNYLEQNITVNLTSNVSGTLPVANGGTGQTIYTDGQLLIGKTDGTLAVNTLTAGAGITINNSDGTVEIVNNSSDPTLQTTYDNSPDGDIALAAGKDFMLSSTVAGFRPPAMTSTQFQLIPLPLNGLQSWSNTENRPIYNRGTDVAPDHVVGAYLSDIISALDNLAYGSMGFQANDSATIISVAGTYVKVNATYVSGNLFGFSQASGTLTYTDTETRVIQIICSLSSLMPVSTANLEYAIFINGVLFPASQTTSFSGSVTDSPVPIAIIAQPILSTGDTIEIFVRNNSTTDNVTVSNCNCTVGTIGGSGTGAVNSLNEAYDVADGSITMTANKPVAILSNDNNSSFIPTLTLEQLQTPVVNQVISNYNVKGKNSVGTVIDYSRMYTQIKNIAAGNESSRVDFFAYAAGLNKLFMRFDGDSLIGGVGGTLSLNTGVTLNNHNLLGIANLTQEVGNTTLNTSNAAVGRTEIKIPGSAGVIIDYTTPLAGMDVGIPLRNYTYGVNATMGTSILPQLGYTSGVFSPVWGTLNGSNIVLANSLQIGQTVSIECSGSLSAVTTGGTGILRASFGSAFSVSSSSINFSGFSGQRPFGLIFKVTMINATQVSASVSGWYSDTSNNLKSFNLFINPYFINFNPAINNAILLEWQPTFGAGNSFDFFANNLNIVKYS